MKFFYCTNLPSEDQSTISATIKVVSEGGHKDCVALFIDLLKAFDTVDPVILATKLHSIRFSGPASTWFSSYMSDRTQCAQFAGSYYPSLTIVGVPQASIL